MSVEFCWSVCEVVGVWSMKVCKESFNVMKVGPVIVVLHLISSVLEYYEYTPAG